MIRYVDTSCFLRLAFSEPGPKLPFDGARMFSSRLCSVELLRGIDRARVVARIDDETVARLYAESRSLLASLSIVELTEQVSKRAGDAFPIAVRALDAVHVASAEILLAAGEAMEFWTHDERLAIAAKSRGLSVFGAKD